MDNCSDVRLARPQRDQSLVAGVGDGDNSLSMRWVKLGSTGCMNHAGGTSAVADSTTGAVVLGPIRHWNVWRLDFRQSAPMRSLMPVADFM